MKVTADDVAQLLAGSPPRQVSAHLAKAVMKGGGTTWFVALFGLVFACLGLLFVVIFFPWRFMDDWRLASDAAQTTRGIITTVQRTSMSINKTRVMEYTFRYTPGDGRLREGRCFTTGQSWQSSAEVEVRYLPTTPDLACVEGARLSEGGWGGAFVLLFPLVGAGFVVWPVVNQVKTRRLLHEGQVTEVDILSVDRTNTRINNQYVYKIVISSSSFSGGQPVTVRRTDRREIDLALNRLRDQQSVYILYDSRNPRRLIFPEALIEGGT
jgi:Protein of unknown function (DUF3592)